MHKFRASAANAWNEVTIKDSKVIHTKGDVVDVEFPVDEVKEIHISRQVGQVHVAKIITDRHSLRITTNFPPAMMSDAHQAVDTFGAFLGALRDHPQNKAVYVVGSDMILMLGVLVLLIGLGGLLAGTWSLLNGNVSDFYMSALGFVVTGLGIGMLKNGQTKKQTSMEFLPYDLEMYA